MYLNEWRRYVRNCSLPRRRRRAWRNSLTSTDMVLYAASASSNARTPAREVLDEWIAHMTFEGETLARAYAAEARSPGSIRRTSCSRAPCRRSGDQANRKPAHQKSKEGQTQQVSCGRCTSWHPPAQGGIQIPGTVDEGAYYESILTKGYESILWMVISPALEAAGYEDLRCRQPDTYGSPWRT